jgi:phosphatidylserine/phosphatidylglycerophosphate/cardiolipin synthase-like enzyme
MPKDWPLGCSSSRWDTFHHKLADAHARAGPYINAETTAGGIAHWATSEVAGSLRSNASDWKAAWKGYISAIIEAAAPNQINHGGPIIGMVIHVFPGDSSDAFCGFSNPAWLVRLSKLGRSAKRGIDNEYLPWDWAEGGDRYFEDLKEAYHDSNIVVPLTYNDPSEQKTFVNGTVCKRSLLSIFMFSTLAGICRHLRVSDVERPNTRL